MNAPAKLDRERAREQFAAEQLVHLPEMLEPALVGGLKAEIEGLRRRAHRSFVPRYKKSGSLSYYQLLEGAPGVIELYRASWMRELVEELAGCALHESPANDPQTCAVYFYDRAGDHMGPHVDSCYYCDPVYVVLIGIENRSGSVLRCEANDRRLDIRTEPGSLTIFNGHTVRHQVTPNGPGEERVVLAFQYLVNPYMSRMTRLRSNLAYAWEYFGPAVLWPRRGKRR